jgi:hypothetical protein
MPGRSSNTSVLVDTYKKYVLYEYDEISIMIELLKIILISSLLAFAGIILIATRRRRRRNYFIKPYFTNHVNLINNNKLYVYP